MNNQSLIASLWAKVASLKTALASLKPIGLQPLVQRKANEVIASMSLLGLPVRITEGYRSETRQNALYAQGRTTPGPIVTNAKAGESLHNYGVAVDFVFRNQGYNATNAQWQTLVHIAKSKGFEWGGDWPSFPDKPHFQLMLGYTLEDFKAGKVDYTKYA